MVNKGSFFHSGLQSLAPAHCLLCGDLASSYDLCRACIKDVPHLEDYCIYCATALHAKGICADCLRKPPAYDSMVAAFAYQYPIDKLIRRMKYQRELELIYGLGSILLEQLRDEGRRVDCLIPVPLHGFRLIHRGFNQALELARFLGKKLSIPVDYQSIVRVHRTSPQFKLSPSARRKNVSKAFSLRRPADYHSVAIVDDIVTSGATVNELTRLLKQAGVKEVSIWTLAKAS